MVTQTQSSAPHASIRLFKNPILEALTHVHPAAPFLVWIPGLLYLLYTMVFALGMGLSTIGAGVAVGLLIWTLTEYTMHRYAFHFKAESKSGKYLVFLFHGIHHDDPQDPTRLVFPLIVSVPLGFAFLYAFRALASDFGLAIFFGFGCGYLVYDYIHFAVHHFRLTSRLGKRLKENHMKHHFIAHGAKWGVSSPLWDHVFRTFD